MLITVEKGMARGVQLIPPDRSFSELHKIIGKSPETVKGPVGQTEKKDFLRSQQAARPIGIKDQWEDVKRASSLTKQF